MALYDSLFNMMDLQAAQVLVTSHDFNEPSFRKNLAASAEDLLSMNVVPVFNENDAISARPASVSHHKRLLEQPAAPNSTHQPGIIASPGAATDALRVELVAAGRSQVQFLPRQRLLGQPPGCGAESRPAGPADRRQRALHWAAHEI